MTRAVILDRDGVINDNRRKVNVNSPSDLILFPWTADAIRSLKAEGFLVMVATNQGGVGLGYMTPGDLTDIHDELEKQLAHGGAAVDAIAACIHSPHAGCSCRKPKPGLLRRLHELHPFVYDESFMVGDRESDVEAGLALGMKTIRIGPGPTKADTSVHNLKQAAEWILSNSKRS